MDNWKIYYNPKCGTCRKVLEAIKSRGIEPEVVEYLKDAPSPGELDSILKMAGLEPEGIVRKKEGLYSELKLGEKKLSRSEWLKTLSRNPILIERPIVVKGNKAMVARPPEKIAEFLN